MGRNRGRRYDDSPKKINMKKVFATIITILVIVMIVISLKRILTPREKPVKEVSTLSTYIAVYENNKWGVIDNKGFQVINLDYDEMIVIPDKNKDIFICNYDINYSDETFKTKVLNKEGQEILKEYNKIEALENTNGTSIWYESNILKFEKDGKYGLIDFEGNELVKPEYEAIYTMPGIEKSIIIEKNGKKGLVNSSMGEIVIEPKYIQIESLLKTYENGYIVKNEANKYGVILPDKTKVLEEKYDDIKHVSGNNYYVVVENQKTKIIDTQEKVILDSGFDSIEDIQIDNLIVIKNNKYGVIDITGKEILAPEYENIKFSGEDNYIVQKNNKYGIVDSQKNIKVDFNYNDIIYVKTADFYEAEKENYKTDILDRTGSIALEDIIISELNLEEGYLRVRIEDDYKYYNFKLEEKSNKDVLTTNTLFLIKENGKYGYENKNGERIVDPIYDDAKEQNTFGYCAVKKDGKWGALKSDGTVIVEPERDLEGYLYVDFISTWNRFNDLSLYVYTK